MSEISMGKNDKAALRAVGCRYLTQKRYDINSKRGDEMRQQLSRVKMMGFFLVLSVVAVVLNHQMMFVSEGIN